MALHCCWVHFVGVLGGIKTYLSSVMLIKTHYTIYLAIEERERVDGGGQLWMTLRMASFFGNFYPYHISYVKDNPYPLLHNSPHAHLRCPPHHGHHHHPLHHRHCWNCLHFRHPGSPSISLGNALRGVIGDLLAPLQMPSAPHPALMSALSELLAVATTNRFSTPGTPTPDASSL